VGTTFARLRKPPALIVIVITLLAYGCPLQAIVHAFGLDERTVAEWRDRAGRHCEKVHQAIIEQGKLDLVHVQADEIRVKARGMIAWMGLALMVSTRLWVAGVVHELSKSVGKGGFGMPCTPAMANGLTDHIWSVFELLSYKVAPSALPIPRRRGHPRTRPLPDPTMPQRPRGRPRKIPLCSSTS
jgi:hypothetical protein